MKSGIILFCSALVVGLGTSSCYNASFMADDDVYVMHESALPVGESLNDPSNYSAFKNNKRNQGVSSAYYDDRNFPGLGNSYFSSQYWILGMGFYNPYYRNSICFPYCSPYMYGYANPIYMVDPFGSMYGFYPTAYYPVYYGGNYWYGSNYIMNNYNPYGFGNNNFGSSYTAINFHSGPRGTLSGNANPGGRSTGEVVLKSTSTVSNNARPNHVGRIESDRLISSGNLEQRQVVGRNDLRTSPPVQYTPSTGKISRGSGISPGSNHRIESSPGRIDNVPSNRGGGLNESPSPGSRGGNGTSGGSGGRSGGNSGGGTGRRN